MKKLSLFSISFLFSLFLFAQNLVSVVPSSANASQTLDVTITGANTHFLQGSETYVEFGFNQGSNTAVNSINILSNTSISANITVPTDIYTGNYDVSVHNSIDGFITLTNAFHVNGITPPSLVSINPNNANSGQTLDVTITGADTHFTQGSSMVNFSFYPGSGTVVNSTNVLSNTSIVANISVPPTTYTGDYTVNVYNSVDGYMYLHNGFHINGVTQPSLVSISPNSANTSQTLDVTITGANTHFVQGSNSNIHFGFDQGSSIVNNYNVLSQTTVAANITIPPYVITGDYYVSIHNDIDGTIYLYNGLHINGVTGPLLTSLNPNYASPGQTLNVTITGANTHFTQGSMTNVVHFGFEQGSTVINYINPLSNTSLVANITVPSNTAFDHYDVSVYNSYDGTVTLYDGFIISGSGLNTIESDAFINIFPNPAFDKIFIESPLLKDEKDKKVLIYNIQGQMILQQKLIQDNNEINISKLDQGVYILQIRLDDGNLLQKRFVVSK